MAHPTKPTGEGQRPADSGSNLVPGAFVRHPDRKDWGVGQIQSMIGTKATVNFEDRGKVTIDTSVIALVAAGAEDDA